MKTKINILCYESFYCDNNNFTSVIRIDWERVKRPKGIWWRPYKGEGCIDRLDGPCMITYHILANKTKYFTTPINKDNEY